MFHDSLTVTYTTMPPIWLTCVRTKEYTSTLEVLPNRVEHGN